MIGSEGLHHEHVRELGGHADRQQVLQRVVGRFEDVRVHRERPHVREHDGVAVGRRFRHVVHGDVAARAGAVLDDDLLADLFAERPLQDARRGVGAAAGLEAHHDRDGLVGKLGEGRGRGERECGSEWHFHQTTPPCRNCSICCALYSSSRRISSVCSPISGVGATTFAGVRESTAAFARMSLRPSFG